MRELPSNCCKRGYRAVILDADGRLSASRSLELDEFEIEFFVQPGETQECAGTFNFINRICSLIGSIVECLNRNSFSEDAKG